jgi:hypothetical protein
MVEQVVVGTGITCASLPLVTVIVQHVLVGPPVTLKAHAHVVHVVGAISMPVPGIFVLIVTGNVPEVVDESKW